MPKSTFTPQYERFRNLLIESRRKAGFTQAQLAACLERPQSFVSKYECGERRLDVVEFLEVAKCLNIDGPEALRLLDTPARPARDGPSDHKPGRPPGKPRAGPSH